jgi:AcrR family transcriptional regulator
MADNGTRERILRAGETAFRRQGYTATGLRAIVEAGHAPWGSVYHFFPGGKEEIATETLARHGERYAAGIDSLSMTAGSLGDAIGAYFDATIAELERSQFLEGCPTASIAVEASATSEPLREACAEVFRLWLAHLADQCEATGLDRERAEGFASLALSAYEGALILSRTMRDSQPLRNVRAQLLEYVATMPCASPGEAHPLNSSGKRPRAITSRIST